MDEEALFALKLSKLQNQVRNWLPGLNRITWDKQDY